MRNVKDAHTEFAIELREKAKHFGLGDGVEGAGGFIGDEEPRAVEDSHGDYDALGLADTKLAGTAAEKVVVIGETDVRERRADGCGAYCLRASGVSVPGFAELRANAKSWIKRGQRTLQDDADFAASERAHLRFSLCE